MKICKPFVFIFVLMTTSSLTLPLLAASPSIESTPEFSNPNFSKAKNSALPAETPADEATVRKFLGVYQHYWDEEPSVRIEVKMSGNRLLIVYHGHEEPRGSPPLYYLTEIKDALVNTLGQLVFKVPEHLLYDEPVKDPKTIKPVGLSTDVLSYRGALENGDLVMTCVSKGDACLDQKMVFKRMK